MIPIPCEYRNRDIKRRQEGRSQRGSSCQVVCSLTSTSISLVVKVASTYPRSSTTSPSKIPEACVIHPTATVPGIPTPERKKRRYERGSEVRKKIFTASRSGISARCLAPAIAQDFASSFIFAIRATVFISMMGSQATQVAMASQIFLVYLQSASRCRDVSSVHRQRGQTPLFCQPLIASRSEVQTQF
uniref:Uncharacterized protein n=1 Tax=Oryza sativa subsp. japonica TaxID=39947 RepID=Q33B24_ORYSJ|nr:hypothetical protein LOC_Os10g05740 [Oryza sativa Japonica Group]